MIRVFPKENIEACPFCGGYDVDFYEYDIDDKNLRYLFHHKCKKEHNAEIAIRGVDFVTLKSAIAGWNNRAMAYFSNMKMEGYKK